MNPIFSLLTGSIALCAGLVAPALAQTDAPARSPAPAATAAQPATESLTARTLYTFLLAEIAGARGEVGVALQAYLDLAQRTRDPRLVRRAVEIALFARDLQAAAEAARIWAEIEPNSAEAKRVLAEVLSGSDDQLEHVQIQLARLLAETDELDAHLMGLNRAFVRVGDKAAVRDVVERLTEPYLDHPEAHFARAQAASAAEDDVASLAAIDQALQLRPDWEPGVLFKAQLLAQNNATADALALLKDHVERHPESRHARLAYARALVTVRQFDAAREQFRALLATSPDDRDLMYAVGLLSAQLEDYDAAVPLLERALGAGHPEGDGIRLNLGQIAEQRKDFERALHWYRSVPPGEQYVEAQIRIAMTLAGQGKVREAREHLARVQANDNTRKRLRLAEAQILRTAGQEPEALALLDGELARNPDDPDLLYESSMLAEATGKTELMEQRLRRLIALKPDHAHAYNALGYSLADRGVRLDEAESLIARALELSPQDPFILDSMGWVRFRRGDAQSALKHLERAYAAQPDPEIAAHLGEVLWSLERKKEAAQIWDKALSADPDNEVLKNVVQRYAGR